jgi:EamA domain-containing membrane protein RarD
VALAVVAGVMGYNFMPSSKKVISNIITYNSNLWTVIYVFLYMHVYCDERKFHAFLNKENSIYIYIYTVIHIFAYMCMHIYASHEYFYPYIG